MYKFDPGFELISCSKLIYVDCWCHAHSHKITCDHPHSLAALKTDFI
jgi:hypothetical protein